MNKKTWKWMYVFFGMGCLVRSTAGTAMDRWPEELQTAITTQGGVFEVISVGTGDQLRLNHQLLKELDDSNVMVAAQWPSQAPARLLLLDLPTSSRSCPDLFMLADVPAGRPASITRSFGNCNGRPLFQETGGRLLISFPAFADQKARTWIYDLEQHRLIDLLHGAITGPLH